MRRRRWLLGVLTLAGPGLLGGCAALRPAPPPAAPPPAPPPPPRPVVAAPPPSLEARVRREPWLARFWEQLTPPQRRRVLARMRAARPPVAEDAAAAAVAWDGLGLPERAALVR